MPRTMQSAKCTPSHKSPSLGLIEFAASIHPTRLAACLDLTLSTPTVVRLQKCSRLQVKLAGLLLNTEIDLNGDSWEADVLGGHDPRRVALLAGSVWHASSLLKLILKHELSVLIRCIGAEAHAFGIRHLPHAIATRSIADPEQLARQIEHDGHACLGAWLNESSALDRNRVLLRLPAGTAAEAPASEHRNAAGPLFSLVMAHLVMEVPTI